MSSTQLLFIIGSLRSASVNAAVAHAAMGLLADDVRADVFDISEVPFYNGDVDTFGIGRYGDKIDDSGVLVDDVTQADLADLLARFVEFARSPVEASEP